MKLKMANRPPWQRFRFIMLRLNSRPGQAVKCATIAGELEVSIKTVQRDVDFMRDRLQLPIRTEPNAGYLVEAPVTICACCGGRV